MLFSFGGLLVGTGSSLKSFISSLPSVFAASHPFYPLSFTNPFGSYGSNLLAHLACRVKPDVAASTLCTKFALITKDPPFFSIMILRPLSTRMMKFCSGSGPD